MPGRTLKRAYVRSVEEHLKCLLRDEGYQQSSCKSRLHSFQKRIFRSSPPFFLLLFSLTFLLRSLFNFFVTFRAVFSSSGHRLAFLRHFSNVEFFSTLVLFFSLCRNPKIKKFLSPRRKKHIRVSKKSLGTAIGGKSTLAALISE